MATKKTNGQRIRELREARLWTQEQLSEVSGIGLRSIQRAEKSEPLSKETLKNLAATFDVYADELIVPRKEPPKETGHTLRILPRITTGKQFGQLADCEGYLFDHEEPSSDSEVGTIASFVSNLQDWGMIWGDLDAGQRIEAEQSMKSLLSELEDAGFWAFGEAYPYSVSSQDSKPPMRWRIACVVIKRKDFPGIVKPDESEENARLPALFPKKPNLSI